MYIFLSFLTGLNHFYAGFQLSSVNSLFVSLMRQKLSQPRNRNDHPLSCQRKLIRFLQRGVYVKTFIHACACAATHAHTQSTIIHWFFCHQKDVFRNMSSGHNIPFCKCFFRLDHVSSFSRSGILTLLKWGLIPPANPVLPDCTYQGMASFSIWSFLKHPELLFAKVLSSSLISFFFS